MVESCRDGCERAEKKEETQVDRKPPVVGCGSQETIYNELRDSTSPTSKFFKNRDESSEIKNGILKFVVVIY